MYIQDKPQKANLSDFEHNILLVATLLGTGSTKESRWWVHFALLAQFTVIQGSVSLLLLPILNWECTDYKQRMLSLGQ